MKFSTTAFALALSCASTVSAVGQLGFDLGVRRNIDGGCKTSLDFLKDFRELSNLTNTVRVYAVSDCGTLGNIAPALAEANFKAYLGIWPTDDAHFANEKAALRAYLPTISVNNIRGLTVGSESLFRADLTAHQLAQKIYDIKNILKNLKDKDGKPWSSVPVGMVESWNILIDGHNAPALEASDIIMANAFSYWQGQTMANSSFSLFDDVMQVMQTIQTIKNSTDFPFWVGETGWATSGGNFGPAVPSLENAATFWQDSICAIRAWGVNTLIFEAYDEAWKPNSSGIEGVEQHWGVLHDDGTPKYNLTCKF